MSSKMYYFIFLQLAPGNVNNLDVVKIAFDQAPVTDQLLILLPPVCDDVDWHCALRFQVRGCTFNAVL